MGSEGEATGIGGATGDNDAPDNTSTSSSGGSGGGAQDSSGSSGQGGAPDATGTAGAGVAAGGTGQSAKHWLLGDATNYAQKPSSMSALARVSILDEDDLWGATESPFEPPNSGVQVAAAEVVSNNPTFVMLMVDQWQYELYSSSAHSRADAIDNYATTVQRVAAALPSFPVGYYAIIPTPDYNAPLQEPTSSQRQGWQNMNTACQPIAQAVGAVYPLLFTFEDDFDRWKTVASSTLQEAHRIAPGKPVYPVIRPRYHDGQKRSQPLPSTLWKQQLEYLYNNTAGAIIWDDRPLEHVSDSTPWWSQTAAMLSTHPDIN